MARGLPLPPPSPVPPAERCKTCGQPTPRTGGEKVMRGRIPSNYHAIRSLPCPKGDPLYPEDVTT